MGEWGEGAEVMIPSLLERAFENYNLENWTGLLRILEYQTVKCESQEPIILEVHGLSSGSTQQGSEKIRHALMVFLTPREVKGSGDLTSLSCLSFPVSQAADGSSSP